jgi:hypothetical protein
MRRLIASLFVLVVAACGEVTVEPDGGGGEIDAPQSSIDAPMTTPIDGPPIDVPTPVSCGDGVINGTDTCDDGANNGTYGHCNATCSGPGARCGDGTQNGPEFCDSGSNNGQYGYCNASCSAFGPRCGDNLVNGPESCDNGSNNGQYGYCNATCSALGPHCGDSITNGPEVCDQGTVYSQSMASGVCRPDCAGTVQQKTIGVTARGLTRGGIAGLDNLCVSTFGANYRAMVVDGSTRIASASPNAGNGQVGWVVGAYTRYVSAETGLLVFITDSSRLIGASGGSDQSLVNPVRASDDGYGAWTGANADWTSGLDCADWTVATSAERGLSCNTATTAPQGFPNNGGTSSCEYDRRFYCVQQ